VDIQMLSTSLSGPKSAALPSVGGAVLSLVAERPVVVASASTLLYYPMNQHVFLDHSGAGPPAIMLRAQTSPDVDLPCADTAFVSYTNGSSWQPGPLEVGTGKYGAHVQKRVCYANPAAGGGDGMTDTALCLPYARDATANCHDARLSAAQRTRCARRGRNDNSSSPPRETWPMNVQYNGTVWHYRGGTLAPVAGTVDSVPVTFSDPFMVEGSRRYTDGNVVRTWVGTGLLSTLYASAKPHVQAKPLAIHVYHSVDGITWSFRARVGAALNANENNWVWLPLAIADMLGSGLAQMMTP
jgi:hypothetical protein